MSLGNEIPTKTASFKAIGGTFASVINFEWKNFYPPFSERSTEELISIAYSDVEHWRKEAIFQVKQELIRRNISKEEQEKTLAKWEKEVYEGLLLEKKRLERNKTESYSKFETAIIFLFGPLIFFRNGFRHYSLFNLRAENYFLKFKQAIILYSLSFLLWFLVFFLTFKYQEEKRLKEIEKTDISDWKE